MSDLEVEAAAIKCQDTIVSLPPPARHHNCIHEAVERGIYEKRCPQGFVLSDGRFVERSEALEVAIKADQIDEGDADGILMSEDLW